MPVVHFKFAAVDATLTSGVITVWSPKLRPGGTSAITGEKREALLSNGEASLNLEPGPIVGHVTGDGATHQLKFTVPSQDEQVEFLDLLEDNYDYEPEIVRAAQQAAREARASANDAAASAAVVGSAERVLQAEAASGAAQSAAELARDAAASSASASAQSASDSAAARDAAVVARGGAESAQGGAELARDAAVVAQGAAELAEDGAVSAQSGSEDARDAAVGSASDASASATAADGSAAAAALSASAAAGSASDAQASAAAAAQSEGVAATAATDAADGVRSELSGLVNTASGHADDAAGSAAAAAQSAQDAASVVSDGVPDASTTMKGKVQLAGDLGGTADAPTVPGLAGKANASHVHAVADVTGLQSALDGKVSTTSTGTRLYGTTSGGSQTQVQYANGATANTVAYRGTGATLPVGEPTDSSHATTKSYVDAALAGKLNASKIQVVSALPSTPDSNVIYFVTG
jgi:hypothetical protein